MAEIREFNKKKKKKKSWPPFPNPKKTHSSDYSHIFSDFLNRIQMEPREYKQLTKAGTECNRRNGLNIGNQYVGGGDKTIRKKMQKVFWTPSQHFVPILCETPHFISHSLGSPTFD